MSTFPPVIIIGAGPNGLHLAYALTRYGIPVRIFDKKPEPTKTSNALGVHVRTLEIWSDLDIIDTALEKGIKIYAANMFANKSHIARIELKNLSTPYPFMLSLPQSETEQMLIEKLDQLNIQVERNAELISLEQTENNVSITINKAGQMETISTPWLIACDGSHSAIRKQLQLKFSGEDLSQHFIMADLAIQTSLPLDELYTYFSTGGVAAIFPLPHNRCRIICEVTNDPALCDTKTPQLDDFIRIAKERCGKNITLSDPAWISAFWIHSRMIENFRHERIFFAGDAAHIHSPVGGQGMNTGMQDTYNLAWKLAYVIQDKAKPSLLDTYNFERHPIAQHVLMQTKAATKMVTLKNRFLQTLRNFALKKILSKPANQQKVAWQLSELNINYRKSPLSINEWENKSKGPEAGDRVPYVKGLFENLKGDLFHLLLFFTQNEKNHELDNIELFIDECHEDKIQVHRIQKNDFNGLAHLNFCANAPCIYLIRPDKYIAYRSMPPDLSKLQSYLQKIF